MSALSHPTSLGERYESVISLLRFFIEDERYSIVDRIAFALSPESAEVAVLEALRIIKSLMERACKIKVRVDQDRTYNLTCCDYGTGEGPGVYGEFIEACRPELKGVKGYCVPCPLIPSSKELEDLLNDLRNDLTIGRKLAILAHGYRGEGSKG